jgi:hypothetical protein
MSQPSAPVPLDDGPSGPGPVVGFERAAPSLAVAADACRSRLGRADDRGGGVLVDAVRLADLNVA